MIWDTSSRLWNIHPILCRGLQRIFSNSAWAPVLCHFQGPISPNKLYIRSGNFALQTEIVETLSQVFPGVFSRVVWFRTEMTNMDFSPVFVDDNYGTMFDSSTGVDWVSVLPFVQHDSHQLQMGIFGQVLVDTGAAAGRVGAWGKVRLIVLTESWSWRNISSSCLNLGKLVAVFLPINDNIGVLRLTFIPGVAKPPVTPSSLRHGVGDLITFF